MKFLIIICILLSFCNGIKIELKGLQHLKEKYTQTRDIECIEDNSGDCSLHLQLSIRNNPIKQNMHILGDTILHTAAGFLCLGLGVAFTTTALIGTDPSYCPVLQLESIKQISQTKTKKKKLIKDNQIFDRILYRNNHFLSSMFIRTRSQISHDKKYKKSNGQPIDIVINFQKEIILEAMLLEKLKLNLAANYLKNEIQWFWSNDDQNFQEFGQIPHEGAEFDLTAYMEQSNQVIIRAIFKHNRDFSYNMLNYLFKLEITFKQKSLDDHQTEFKLISKFSSSGVLVSKKLLELSDPLRLFCDMQPRCKSENIIQIDDINYPFLLRGVDIMNKNLRQLSFIQGFKQKWDGLSVRDKSALCDAADLFDITEIVHYIEIQIAQTKEPQMIYRLLMFMNNRFNDQLQRKFWQLMEESAKSRPDVHDFFETLIRDE